jgi:hypothetical protein
MGDRHKVCKKCGWYMTNLPQNHECRLDLAADVAKLASLLSDAGIDVPSTKLGYGDGNVTFTPNENVSITFRCDGHGRFSIDHVFFIQPIDFKIATKLVESFVAASAMEPEKLPCKCGGPWDGHFFMRGPRACQHCATCEGYEEVES